jgi:hypothetical protein
VTAHFSGELSRRGAATVTSVRLSVARARDRLAGMAASLDRRGGKARNRDE